MSGVQVLQGAYSLFLKDPDSYLMATINQPLKSASGKGRGVSPQSESPIDQLKAYLKGVRAEWDKITWLSWPQIWGQTIVVLVIVTLMTFILFIMDYSFHFIISNIVPHRL
jgi:preprotein translocase SecE subunit